jgi:hypothetical protein
MGSSTIEYVGRDTIKPIAKYKGPFPKAHVYNKFAGTNLGQGFDTLPNLYICGQFLTKQERDSINAYYNKIMQQQGQLLNLPSQHIYLKQ